MRRGSSEYLISPATAHESDITDNQTIGQLSKIKDRAKTWQEIWNYRNISDMNQSKDISLQDLLIADGFDTPTAKLNSLVYWEEYIRFITKKIDLAPGDSLFEIGCGCGAFLYLWYKEGRLVGGIDYSENLISLAKHVMKGMDFGVSEAIELNTDEQYDVVLSNGVFLYFKDYSYARKVVEKMIMKARKTVAILEIPDLAKIGESEKARRAALPKGEYDKKYEGLHHLYFERDWFTQFSDTFGYDVDVFDQNITGYDNSQFRFNVVIKK